MQPKSCRSAIGRTSPAPVLVERKSFHLCESALVSVGTQPPGMDFPSLRS